MPWRSPAEKRCIVYFPGGGAGYRQVRSPNHCAWRPGRFGVDGTRCVDRPGHAHAVSRAAAPTRADRVTSPVDQRRRKLDRSLGVCTSKVATFAAGEAPGFGTSTAGPLYLRAPGARIARALA